MAAFGWAETYHREARRKSVFHAAAALCDIRFPLPRITHAPMPAEQMHWDGASDARRSADYERKPGGLPQRIEKIPWHDRQDDNDLAERRRRSAAERGAARFMSAWLGRIAKPGIQS
jgi:hypothetical protein